MKIALCIAACLTVVLFSQETSAGAVDDVTNEARKLLADSQQLLKEVSKNAKKHAKSALNELRLRLNQLNNKINGWFDKPPHILKSIYDLTMKVLDNVQSFIK